MNGEDGGIMGLRWRMEGSHDLLEIESLRFTNCDRAMSGEDGELVVGFSHADRDRKRVLRWIR